jgi:hypothetical protein
MVISEGAGMGDNSPSGPFFDHAAAQLDERSFHELRDTYPIFGLTNREEAFYFSIFLRRFGALPLSAERPLVNTLPTDS